MTSESPGAILIEMEGIRWKFIWYDGGVSAVPGVTRTPVWLFHGPDSQLIETPLHFNDLPRAFIEAELRQWLDDWLGLHAVRRLEVDGTLWFVRRQVPITVGYAVPGRRIPMPPPGGLVFTNGTERRLAGGDWSRKAFVEIDQPELRRQFGRATPIPDPQ